MMPRDVSTCWNFTYDMLEFAITYHKALDKVTGDCDLNLRKFELSGEDWMIATNLRDVLKVSQPALLCIFNLINSIIFSCSKTQVYFFHAIHQISPTVIPAMDHIDQHLATAATN